MRTCRSNLNRRSDGCLNVVLSSSNFLSILHSRSYSVVLIDALISLFIKSVNIKKSAVFAHEGKIWNVKIPPRRHRELTNTTWPREDWSLMFYKAFSPRNFTMQQFYHLKISENKYCCCASSFRKKNAQTIGPAELWNEGECFRGLLERKCAVSTMTAWKTVCTRLRHLFSFYFRSLTSQIYCTMSKT